MNDVEVDLLKSNAIENINCHSQFNFLFAIVIPIISYHLSMLFGGKGGNSARGGTLF